MLNNRLISCLIPRTSYCAWKHSVRCLASQSTVLGLTGSSRLRAKAKRTSHTSEHWYEQLMKPYTKRESLLEYLHQNILYQDEHIVALNKPNGIPMYAMKYHEDLPSNVRPPVGANLCMTDLVKQMVNLRQAKVKLGQPRLYSGVTVFAKTEKAESVLQRHFRQVTSAKLLKQHYWIISLGIPEVTPDVLEKIYIEQKEIGEYLMSVKSKGSLTKRLHRKQTMSEIQCKVLSTFRGSQCRLALLQISPSNVRMDAMELYMLHKLSPVLGDHLYSTRLKCVLDRPVLQDPMTCQPCPQVLPTEVVNMLQLSSEEAGHIPLHIHCHQVELPDVNSPKKRITIDAPLPEFFQRTLISLRLQLPET